MTATRIVELWDQEREEERRLEDQKIERALRRKAVLEASSGEESFGEESFGEGGSAGEGSKEEEEGSRVEELRTLNNFLSERGYLVTVEDEEYVIDGENIWQYTRKCEDKCEDKWEVLLLQ